jgi:cytochrome c553
MAMRKRALIFAAVATVVVVLAVPGVALAFDTVHGGYAADTDACAGCHRAHTASSPITWTDGGSDTRSALLISTAESDEEFCYTCHGSAAVGADTNVYDGVFQSRDGDLGGDEVYNDDMEPLNGGGFNLSMYPTQHYPGGATWVAWGAGNDGRDGIITMGGEKVVISCTTCHDTHGSSNYRLLKDIVAGIDPTTGASAPITVGGYDLSDNPTPYVISSEEGYPVGGWPKGDARMLLYETYYPDFTDPRYAKAPDDDPTKGISGWCSACHTQMNTKGDSGNVFDANGTANDGYIGLGGNDYLAEIYDANDGFGLVERHRHPTNVALSTFDGSSPLVYDSADGVPLAHDPAEGNTGLVLTETSTDWVDCLSCHVAHGSGATMIGYASVADSTNPQPDTGTKSVTIDGSTVVTVGSVPPDYGNALLRLNNRGTCQACHNK